MFIRPRAIRERYRSFDRRIRDIPHTVCYSVKANSNLSILGLLAELGPASTLFPAASCSACWRPIRKRRRKSFSPALANRRDEIDLALRAGNFAVQR